MKDTKEIVLFFKENSKYVPLDIAKEICERYPELGNPIILPEIENKKTPLIVFNENPSFQIQSNVDRLTVVMDHSYFNKVASIIFDMVDAFLEVECEFVRIGYISNVFLSPKQIDRAKKKYLNMSEFEDVGDINLSWYRKLDTGCGEINCWERIITDEASFKDLLCQYDFNTKVTEEVKLEMKYIKEFFKVTNEYIEDRINF